MFIPTTFSEMQALGWAKADVILVTGDTYIDSPFIGVAVVGKVLMAAGFRVGIIAQPGTEGDRDITRLGEPELFWGITAGSVDSMVANYTATGKKRFGDDFTPGGKNKMRPDRATIVYANLIRRFFKNTKPLVLGGLEASLRRIAHYDYWSDTIRKAILFDAKADFLLYGMAEKTVVQLASQLREGKEVTDIRGLCYITPEPPADYLVLPSFEEVREDKDKFIEMFRTFYVNNDPRTAVGICQQQDKRFLVQNPPAPYLTEPELSAVYDLDFERDAHPFYKKEGPVRALETIRFSIPTHQGCYGECNFCSIAVHQGRTVRTRSEESIIREAEHLTGLPDFKGYILDLGGPTANMYGSECAGKRKRGACAGKRCLHPKVCPNLKVSHERQLRLLCRLRRLPGLKKVFIASGLRYDLILNDREHGREFLREVLDYHLSGQLKVAPEHSEDRVLSRMGKPGRDSLREFKALYDELAKETGKKQYLTYYLMAAHPGCDLDEMRRLREFAVRELKHLPEQVQIFTPLPSTWSAVMYHTGKDPFTGEKVFVERDKGRKEEQKRVVAPKPPSGNRSGHN